jgi:hypothetical protein
VLCVTPEPAGLRLPTTEIVPPQGLWGFVFKRLFLVAAIALIMVWAIGNTKKGMIEAVLGLGAVIVIAAIEVPLLKRRWQRLEQRQLASLPGDVIYVGPARAESLPGSFDARPVPGELLVDQRGLTFTPKQTGQGPVLSITWTQMRNVSLHPISSAPLAGSLVLTLSGGSTRSFVVQRCASLADKLQNLPDRL